MTDTITATENFTAARARHATAQANYNAAKSALDNADAARSALITKAAATGADVGSEMELHRASLGGLADAVDLTGAILAETKIQLDATELAVLEEKAASFTEGWENVIRDCVLKASAADVARAAAQDAMNALDVAQQAVIQAAQNARLHDNVVQDALNNNARIAAMHPSAQPLIGKRMDAGIIYGSPRPKLILATRNGPDIWPFSRTMVELTLSQLGDKIPVAKLMEIVALLSDTSGVV
jgi:hypothetical protein